MAFQDKFRALRFGIAAGVRASEVAGEKILFIKHAPLELEILLARWLLLHGDLVNQDSPTCALRFDEPGQIGITWAVWGLFLDWMGEQLGGASAGQGDMRDAGHTFREGLVAGTPASDLHGEPVLYIDSAPVELRAALRSWADTSPEVSTLFDDDGRAALAWEDWEFFLGILQVRLSEALDELEIPDEQKGKSGV